MAEVQGQSVIRRTSEWLGTGMLMAPILGEVALQAEVKAAKGAARVARWMTGRFVRTIPVPFTSDATTVDKERLGELGFSDERQEVVGEVLDSLGQEVDKNRLLGVNRAAGDLVYIVRQEMPGADPADHADRFTQVVTEATSLSSTRAEHMLGLQDPQRLLQ